MTNAATWMATICATPDDDAPRLAFADWLDHHGDPARAEIMRTQIALAGSLPRAERQCLRQRNRQLLHQHEARLLAALPTLNGISWTRHWDRGLPAGCVARSAKAVRDHEQTIFSATVVRHLSLNPLLPQELGDLLHRAALAVLHSHHLGLPRHEQNADDILRVLVSSQHLSNLHSLCIQARLRGDGVRILANAATLSNLQKLDLGNNALTGADLATLAESPFLGQLRELRVIQNEIDDDGLIAVGRSTSLKSLHTIHLTGNRHTDLGLRNLLLGQERPWRDLWIGSGHGITQETTRVLAHAPNLGERRRLDLSECPLGDAGVMHLAHAPTLPRLRSLSVRGTQLSAAGVAELARSRLASRLRYLYLDDNNFGNPGAWELVRSQRLDRLQKLRLWDCDALKEGVQIALRHRFGKRVVVPAEAHDVEEHRVHLASATTADALLEDIRHHPDDDAPRLVYADWIEDQGDGDRATFIRTQCRLARLEDDHPDKAELQVLESQLLDKHRWDWTEGACVRWLAHPPHS